MWAIFIKGALLSFMVVWGYRLFADPNSKSTAVFNKTGFVFMSLFSFLFVLYGDGYDPNVDYVSAYNNTINQTAANNAVKQYEIAERHGDKMQMYVQASICAATYLQAQDEENYKKWKEIEKSLGRKVGIPQY